MSVSGSIASTADTPRTTRPAVPVALTVFDATLRALERVGLIGGSFDEESLCAAAIRKTGLSDFGDDRFREGIRQHSRTPDIADRLGASIRFLSRLVAVQALCNRLRVQQEIKDHPEILQVTVPRPLIVVGMMRTGTTLLQNLLAQDPAARSLLVWEAMSPVKPRTRWGHDPRRRRAERVVWLIKRAYPRLLALHTIDANGPQECGPLFRSSFVLPIFGKNFQQWMSEVSAERLQFAYADYYRQLQLLQWQRPAAGHWLLKWPGHMLGLDTLVQTLPGAGVVQTHRDPCHVVASFCQLISHLAFFYSDERLAALPPELVAITAELLGRSAKVRPHIPSNRIFDVHYKQLMKDPMGVLRQIYDHFGYSYTDEFERRARRWLDANPRRERAANYHDLEQFGLDRAALERTFASYCERYGVEPET